MEHLVTPAATHATAARPQEAWRGRSARRLLPLLLALVGLATAPSSAATLTVTTTSDSGPGSLRQAIANAKSGDQIVFQVTDTITLTSGPLQVSQDLRIQGPGATVLTISGDDDTRVFQIASGATVVLSGLTITGGRVDDSSFVLGVEGGGILNNGTLTVRDSRVSGNIADVRGGGIANHGTLTVSNSSVSGNLTAKSGSGGGIYNTATLTVSNSTLSSNTAGGGGGSGGSIGNATSATAAVSNSTLSDNTAGGFGGGISNGGTLSVSNSTLSDNDAPGGGGISNSSTLTVSNSTLSGNTAGGGGGILNFGSVKVSSSTFSGNTAAFGGGLRNSGTAKVSNSTLSANTASTGGGGIYNSAGTVTVSNSTLSDNSAATGGGISIAGGTATVGNTIVAFSTGGDCVGTINSVAPNLSTDPCLGFTQVTTDQLKLGTLEFNGGPTRTQALLAGSVAINAGDDSLRTDPITEGSLKWDQRGIGFPRRIGGQIDIGAYELQP